jgi:hypothetical protein
MYKFVRVHLHASALRWCHYGGLSDDGTHGVGDFVHLLYIDHHELFKRCIKCVINFRSSAAVVRLGQFRNVSRSHPDAPQLVGLPWMSYWATAETST